MVTIYDIDGNVLREFPNLDTLAGADLSYENLMFADLRDMDLTNTIFHGANMFGAKIDNSIVDGTDFSDTCLEIVGTCGFGVPYSRRRGY